MADFAQKIELDKFDPDCSWIVNFCDRISLKSIPGV
jgi:hypothetical protein